MSARTTRFRLLPLAGAVTLLVLLACQVSLAQEEDEWEHTTEATTTTTTGRTNINRRYGRGNIIIGGQFGLTDEGRQKRRASRRQSGDEPSNSYSLSEVVSGKRRKSRRRDRRGSDDTDAEELADKIDALADANQELANSGSANSRSRRPAAGYARRYFGGMGRDIMGFGNRARETLDNAVTDMLGGVNNLLRMIPYDEIETTALRVASYVDQLVESGMPDQLLDSLMSSRAGGARETMEALVAFQGSPEILEPILEDVAANYRKFFRGASGQVENFLSLIVPRRQPDTNNPSPPVLETLPPADLDNDQGPATGGFAPVDLVGDENQILADPNGEGDEQE